MKNKQLFSILFFLCGAILSFTAMDLLIITASCSLSGMKLNEGFWCLGLQHFGFELMALSGFLFVSRFVHNTNNFLLLSLTGIILLFCAFLFQYTVNIPITDDYRTILLFSNRYFFTDSLKEKFSLFSAFHGECRLITTRILIISLHFITGTVNIKSLVIIANCCLPVILILFYKSIKKEKMRMEMTVLIALLFFQLGYYDALVWATDALHYQFAILFLMLSLYLLNKNTLSSQALSLIAALFASLTFGNGLLIFPLALLYYIREKNWKFVVLWTATALVFIAFYFHNFFSIPSVNSSHPILAYLTYSCCFLGGAFQFMYQLYLPFALGLMIWILFLFLTYKKYYQTNYFIYSLILFVLLSSLIAAHFRLRMGLVESISNRYGIFSILALCASLSAIAESIQQKKQKSFLVIAFTFCIAYHLLSGIFFFPEVPIRKQKLEAFISDIKNDAPFKPLSTIPPGADSIVREAMQKKIYFP